MNQQQQPSRGRGGKHDGFMVIDPVQNQGPPGQFNPNNSYQTLSWRNTQSTNNRMSNFQNQTDTFSQSTQVQRMTQNQLSSGREFKNETMFTSPRRMNVQGSDRDPLMMLSPNTNKQRQDQIKKQENCYHCQTKFTHFMTKRYECEQCKNSFCYKHCKNEFVEGETNMIKKKLCLNCIKNHNQFSKMLYKTNMMRDILQKNQMNQENDFINGQNARNSNNLRSEVNSRFKKSDKGSNYQSVLDDQNLNSDTDKMNIQKIKDKMRDEGQAAAAELTAVLSKAVANKYRSLANSELHDNEQSKNRSKSRKLSLMDQKQLNEAKYQPLRSQNRSHNELGQIVETQQNTEFDFNSTENQDDLDEMMNPDLMQEQMFGFMDDILMRVMNEFKIDKPKWENILRDFVRQAIQTVKPWSTQLNDSIDITKYVKIQLINYKDTSKCKYINGVVLKKALAHNRMKNQYKDPKILILAGTLGIQRDDEEFQDLHQDMQQEETYLNQIVGKIQEFQPNLIFVHQEATMKAVERMLELDITVVQNVKDSVIKRIERLTQTCSLPNVNLLSSDFFAGQCQQFYMETLSNKGLQRNDHNDNHLIYLDGCLPFLGCTILLSSRDMQELKLVKHALKKILRLSRQLILENEFYQVLNLTTIPESKREEVPQSDGCDQSTQDQQQAQKDGSSQGDKDSNKPQSIQTTFLHTKHMERDFLIFKEVSFSKRENQSKWEDDEENPQEIDKNEAAQMVSEKVVQARIQRICAPPQMKRVRFYQEENEKEKEALNDISLGKKLRSLCQKSIRKCKNQDCKVYEMFHKSHFYHQDGYVEMKMRLSKEVNQSPEDIKNQSRIKQSEDFPIYLDIHCESCNKSLIERELVTRQLQEFSFYSFIEQFFYNRQKLMLYQHGDSAKCCHAFLRYAKIIFIIDILRIEFQYHPVKIYSLDLICFKDQQGTLSDQKRLINVNSQRDSLLSNTVETLDFIVQYSHELQSWLTSIVSSEILKGENFLPARNIIETIKLYLENLDVNVQEYKTRASDTVKQIKVHHEFYLNKAQHLICCRVLDYLFILNELSKQIFEEFILNIASTPSKPKDQRNKPKKEIVLILSQLANHQNNFGRRGTNKPIKDQNTTQDEDSPLVIGTDNTKFDSKSKQKSENRKKESTVSDSQGGGQSMQSSVVNDVEFTKVNDNDQIRTNSDIRTESITKNNATNADILYNLIDFQDRLKAFLQVNDLMKLSASVPSGLDLNSIQFDQNDLSTIICHSMISNEHLIGLKEQGYMDLESRLDKQKYFYKHPQIYLGLQHQQQNIKNKQNAGRLNDDPKDLDKNKETVNPSLIKDSLQPVMEEFLVFKENQNILNKEISQKEIETELLRIEQFNFQINFSNYQGPHQSMLYLMKGDQVNKENPIKIERKVLSSLKILEPLDKIQPADIDPQFYWDLNNIIIKKIHDFKSLKETKQHNIELQPQQLKEDDKYEIFALFNEKTDNKGYKQDPRVNIEVQMYYPSHFQALRKLYCGSQNVQSESLFKSKKWQATGGKTKSDFYQSFDQKYVMKCISDSEIKRFNEFALSYFEYMCRSFNQKCPTSIGKILGAYKITIKSPDTRQKPETYNVIMMENLFIGIDSDKPLLAKYDLKGSMSRRYIKPEKDDNFKVTRLDTNLIEDQNSIPICMNYVMNRLMEIAIHNDTSFLDRHERIDYSMVAWIDHERKLIRVGIIDYIQNYSIEKQLESKWKTTFSSTGNPPTILNPKSYKDRFKRAMSNYFMSILEDKPSRSFKELLDEQMEQKTKWDHADAEKALSIQKNQLSI